jgi:hypothetical protein
VYGNKELSKYCPLSFKTDEFLSKKKKKGRESKNVKEMSNVCPLLVPHLVHDPEKCRRED